jgi:AraC-like DNA-binding protein
VRDAVAPATVQVCASATDVLRAIREQTTSIVLLDSHDESGCCTTDLIETIRSGFPTVPVVALCERLRVSAAELLALARADVHGLLFVETDELRHVLPTTLRAAAHQVTAEIVLRALAGRVATDVRPLLRYLLVHASEPLRVDRAAAALGVSRRTMHHRLARAGYPAAGILIGWCRLFLVGRLLEDSARSVEQISELLDFPSSSALRNMMKRYTGKTPQEIREVGGLEGVLRCFLMRVEAGTYATTTGAGAPRVDYGPRTITDPP